MTKAKIPDHRGWVHKVVLGLSDVRAADSIRISYDFHRDGWKIEQAKFFSWGEDATEECPEGWTEVAFVQAWALEEEHPSMKARDPDAGAE